MKKLLFIVAICLATAGCAKFEEYENRVGDLEGQVSGLEGQVGDLEGQVGNLEGQIGDLEGQVDSLASQLSDFNLPSNIIMLSKEIDDVIKSDTIVLNVIVNPSDFPVDKDHISFLAIHDIYTKYNVLFDEYGYKVGEDPFDETARCDLSVVELEKLEEYEGGYRVAVAVGGEGNFFDDIDLYLLYCNDTHDGKEHHVCSNTPAEIHVIPSIEEGLTPEFIGQSLYSIDLKEKCKSTEMKPILGGLWLSTYKNAFDRRKIYDRSKLSNIICGSDEMAEGFAIVDSLFQEYGILSIDPVPESEFWQNALKAYEEDGVNVTSIPNAGIQLSRGEETKVLPIDVKLYLDNYFEHTLTTTEAALKEGGRQLHLDLKEDFETAGWSDEGDLSDYFSFVHSSADLGQRAIGSIDDETKMLTMDFWSTAPTTNPDKPCEYYSMRRIVIRGEDKEGAAHPLESIIGDRCCNVSFILEKIHVDITE